MTTADPMERGEPLYGGGSLPAGSIGMSASGWWGVWFLMISEAFLFAYQLFTYFYFSVQPNANWVPGGKPSFLYPAIQTVLVLAGCATAWFAHRSMQRNEFLLSVAGLGATLLLCSGFIAVQFLDWFDKKFEFYSSTYSSIYFLITGTHMAHVVLGWIILLMVLIWTALGYFDAIRCVPIRIAKIYWYFVAVIWLAIFFTLTCTPYFT